MSPDLLPNETLEAIFTGLPPHTLATLARVSDRFNAVAERLLYTSPVITDIITPASPSPLRTLWWCNGMQRRGREYLLQSTVKRLSIRWQTTQRRNSNVGIVGGHDGDPQISEAVLLNACECLGEILPRLTGLESLELWLGPANLIQSHDFQTHFFHPQSQALEHLYQRGPSTGVPIIRPMHSIERVLWNCRFPLLRSCFLGAEWRRGAQSYTSVLPNFLKGLDNLRQLKISDLGDPSSLEALESLLITDNDSCHQLPASGTLPLLNSFRGSAGAAAILIPNRSIRHLALVGPDSDLNSFNMVRMAKGSVPLKTLDLSAMSVRMVLLQDISLHFGVVSCLRVRLALRHTLHFADSGVVSPLFRPPFPLSWHPAWFVMQLMCYDAAFHACFRLSCTRSPFSMPRLPHFFFFTHVLKSSRTNLILYSFFSSLTRTPTIVHQPTSCASFTLFSRKPHGHKSPGTVATWL